MKEKFVDGKICIKESCFHCCIETEMILSKADVKRITQETGLSSPEYSTFDEKSHTVLRNKKDQDIEICYFLSTERKCTIYKIRPEGCRYYPIIWNFYNQQAFSDDYCPHHKQFNDQVPRISSSLEMFILKLFGEL
ncbi:MAG: YkgJ family cysteine cluster protein [Candidatus Hodarchaeales archaeon]|jgi:Fe-S-cluster containining protein